MWNKPSINSFASNAKPFDTPIPPTENLLQFLSRRQCGILGNGSSRHMCTNLNEMSAANVGELIETSFLSQVKCLMLQYINMIRLNMLL